MAEMLMYRGIEGSEIVLKSHYHLPTHEQWSGNGDNDWRFCW